MKDSVVLVTGGAGNLGRAVTRRFLERDARVVVPFYKTDAPDALDELRSEFGDRFHSFALDLTTERGAQQAVIQTVEWGGRIDAVAHLVGGYAGGVELVETPLAVWERMIDLNLKSALLIGRFAIPAMLERAGGSLVFVSSRAAREGRSGNSAYAVTKSALITLVEAMAEEYGARGIRANTVLPGVIDTEANRRAMPGADHELWPSAEDLAKVIVFLASGEAAVVNGGSIPVHGRS